MNTGPIIARIAVIPLTLAGIWAYNAFNGGNKNRQVTPERPKTSLPKSCCCPECSHLQMSMSNHGPLSDPVANGMRYLAHQKEHEPKPKPLIAEK